MSGTTEHAGSRFIDRHLSRGRRLAQPVIRHVAMCDWYRLRWLPNGASMLMVARRRA